MFKCEVECCVVCEFVLKVGICGLEVYRLFGCVCGLFGEGLEEIKLIIFGVIIVVDICCGW